MRLAVLCTTLLSGSPSQLKNRLLLTFPLVQLSSHGTNDGTYKPWVLLLLTHYNLGADDYKRVVAKKRLIESDFAISEDDLTRHSKYRRLRPPTIKATAPPFVKLAKPSALAYDAQSKRYSLPKATRRGHFSFAGGNIDIGRVGNQNPNKPTQCPMETRSQVTVLLFQKTRRTRQLYPLAKTQPMFKA